MNRSTLFVISALITLTVIVQQRSQISDSDLKKMVSLDGASVQIASSKIRVRHQTNIILKQQGIEQALGITGPIYTGESRVTNRAELVSNMQFPPRLTVDVRLLDSPIAAQFVALGIVSSGNHTTLGKTLYGRSLWSGAKLGDETYVWPPAMSHSNTYSIFVRDGSGVISVTYTPAGWLEGKGIKFAQTGRTEQDMLEQLAKLVLRRMTGQDK